MGPFLHSLNEFQGAICLLILLVLAGCAKSLAAIALNLDCMHEDYNQIHEAHDTIAFKRQAEAESRIGAERPVVATKHQK